MIAKFILLVVFVHGHGPRTNYAQLGEYYTSQACQSAAAAVLAQYRALGLMGASNPRFICVAK